jgi:predicted RecA/RadA family phage recombinase
MAETGLKLRCDGPRWESFPVVAPSPGVSAGQMDLIHDTVGVYMQDAVTGADVAFCYRAAKVLLPKVEGSTYGIFEAGDLLYFDHSNAELTSNSSGNKRCAICLVAAGAADTEVLVDLLGNMAV